MESELAGSSSGGVLSDAYDYNRTATVVDGANSPDFQNFVTYKDSNENVVFVPNYTIKKEASLPCDNENLTENVEEASKENNGQEAADVYLSTGIYIQPLRFNENYENIIELIDVDPNETIDDSPLPNNEDCKTNTVLDKQQCDVAVTCVVPMKNGVVPFFYNYARIPLNNDLQSLQVIYNTPSTASNSPSEDVNFIPFLPNDVKKTVPPFLRRNRKLKSATVETQPERKEIETNHGDDDIIFVKEWALSANLEKFYSNNLNPNAKTININNTNVQATTSSSSSPTTTVRRRKRRRTFGEKRKNPARKAQIDKASMDLAEKLSIHPSVFNARVKGRKPKQKIVVETQNLRQSCRTTGAILSPPRALTEYDYKEWPVDGMHERPFYDESTNTIIKYHIPNNTATKNDECANRRPVLSELPVPQVKTYKKHKSDGLLHVNSIRKNSKKSPTNNIQHLNDFAKIALDRLQMMFGYVQELREFDRLVAAGTSSNQGNQLCLRKPTVYEKSLEFRLYQNGIKKNKLEAILPKILKGCKEENIKNVQAMLHETCILYSLASGVNGKDVANLVNSYADKGKNWIRPQI